MMLIQFLLSPGTHFPDIDCSQNFNGEYNPQDVDLDFTLVVSDQTECSVNCDTSIGPDDTGVELFSSNTSEVTITIEQNCKPVADGGREVVLNKGTSYETTRYTKEFRAHTGQEFELDASRSTDSTPTGHLIYEWTIPSTDPDFQMLSDVHNAVYTIPSDLCVDDVSLSEKSCCENNSGIWLNDGTCNTEGLWKKVCDNNWTTQCLEDEDCGTGNKCITGNKLTFNLRVSDGELENGTYAWSDYDEISIYYNAYSIPAQPTLYATGTHYPEDDFGTINLFLDNKAEDSIDDLTLYADFQGYKIYRSDDYGQTWGSAIAIVDGEILGWEPYSQVHMSAEQDSTSCLFTNETAASGRLQYRFSGKCNK